MKYIERVQIEYLKEVAKQVECFKQIGSVKKNIIENLVCDENSIWFERMIIPAFSTEGAISAQAFARNLDDLTLEDVLFIWKVIEKKWTYAFGKEFYIQSFKFVKAFHQMYRDDKDEFENRIKNSKLKNEDFRKDKSFAGIFKSEELIEIIINGDSKC